MYITPTSKIRAIPTPTMIVALKRAQFSFLERKDLPREHRALLVRSLNFVLTAVYAKCGSDEVGDRVVIEAHRAFDDSPDFSAEDAIPLFALASTIGDDVIKSLIRSVGQQAMKL